MQDPRRSSRAVVRPHKTNPTLTALRPKNENVVDGTGHFGIDYRMRSFREVYLRRPVVWRLAESNRPGWMSSPSLPAPAATSIQIIPPSLRAAVLLLRHIFPQSFQINTPTPSAGFCDPGPTIPKSLERVFGLLAIFLHPFCNRVRVKLLS